ncbi:hypothetical protein KC19_2G057800 [Ceratodon purpureus]|uniref:Protein kinase domain-containing protein n=1 Tax=Ceratodon purpureus TaxID=3225 RepID=A0A8T0ITN9_CERPU|nr:hypothetical protein KC19_2G057800 [Ceratodon purpureus]
MRFKECNQRHLHRYSSRNHVIALHLLDCEVSGVASSIVGVFQLQVGEAGMGACTSALASELKEMQLSDPCCTAGASMETEFHTALQPDSERATSASSSFLTALGSESVVESGKCSSDVERIETSKVHWSELSEAVFDSDDDGAVEEDNRKVFRELQSHPTWHRFFRTFGYKLGVPVPGRPGYFRGSSGELVVEEKAFAEGGQAELFHARVNWGDSKYNEWQQKEGREWVVKVFKKGTSLRQLQVQWPHGYLQFIGETYSTRNFAEFIRYHCLVMSGVLLEDGRFAFLLVREHEDLRCLIEKRMLEIGEERGPFTKEEGEEIMYRIAKGMEWLHEHNIVHRDLKASNVLCDKGWIGVADFECSIGVIGTRFWRAPEILQAIKDKKVSERPEVFSREADVYAYGMTCYEILTGKIPFAILPVWDYSIVLNGGQPDLPKYVEDWMCDLLRGCWKHDPKERPSFKDILNIFVTYSVGVRDYLERERTFLENMRNKAVE